MSSTVSLHYLLNVLSVVQFARTCLISSAFNVSLFSNASASLTCCWLCVLRIFFARSYESYSREIREDSLKVTLANYTNGHRDEPEESSWFHCRCVPRWCLKCHLQPPMSCALRQRCARQSKWTTHQRLVWEKWMIVARWEWDEPCQTCPSLWPCW